MQQKTEDTARFSNLIKGGAGKSLGKTASPFRTGIISLMLMGVFGVIGSWTSHLVWESIVRTYSANLTAILDADIAALHIWSTNEISSTRSQANTPLVCSQVKSLIAIHRQHPGDAGKLRESTQLRTLQDWALPLQIDQDYWGFFVIDRDGTIVAASVSEPYIGMTLSETFANQLPRVFAGDAFLQKPHLQGSYLPQARTHLDNQPIMVAVAPVSDTDGTVMAAFVRVLNPDKDFTRILSVARMGASGDTYAFDAQAFLLSDSRFDEQLKAIGLLPQKKEARSILAVQIRDPGGDMTKGYRPKLPVEQRPLTRMAAAAINGRSGVDIEGYRDYRGVTVIGAWKWLPEYGFGVATEVRKFDAFMGHRPVILAFGGIVIVLAAASGWFLYSSFAIHRLKGRIAEIKQLGQYRLIEKIGEGGMGKVFKAKHALLKRPTAVKFLKSESLSQEMIQRFEREVQLTSSLTHPNTIQIFDYGRTEQGIFYYAMELLDGINLAQLVALEGAVPVARALHILKHVCYSLEEAHAIGLIHRDIKPMNIMLCTLGGRVDCVKVLDFGLAKEMDALPETDLTLHQGIIGTPAYIAPERLMGENGLDVRSDIYSLGSVAYNLLTGEDVFIAPNMFEVCYHVMKTIPPKPSERLGQNLPEPLEQLVMECLAKDPVHRPANISMIVEVLEELGKSHPWKQEQAYLWWQVNKERVIGKTATNTKHAEKEIQAM